MKGLITSAMLAVTLTASRAMAEGPIPTYFDGLLTLNAEKGCEDLQIDSADQYTLIAESGRLVLNNSADKFVFRFFVPRDGHYIFQDPAFPSADEFVNRNGSVDIKKAVGPGSISELVITAKTAAGTKTCILTDASGSL